MQLLLYLALQPLDGVLKLLVRVPFVPQLTNETLVVSLILNVLRCTLKNAHFGFLSPLVQESKLVVQLDSEHGRVVLHLVRDMNFAVVVGFGSIVCE